MKRTPEPERWLVTFIAVVTGGAAYLADWNVTHIHNPRWPPHAKFHNAQTMLLGTALGALALYLLWAKRKERTDSFGLAVTVTSIYWFTQIGSLFFPGTALVDPEFIDRVPQIKGFTVNQLGIDAVLLALLGVAYLFHYVRKTR